MTEAQAMRKELCRLLAAADATLAEIAVKGEDVFRMVTARKQMKAVFDILEKEETKEEEV